MLSRSATKSVFACIPFAWLWMLGLSSGDEAQAAQFIGAGVLTLISLGLLVGSGIQLLRRRW